MSNRDLRIMACTFCRDPQFQEWAQQQDPGLSIVAAGKSAREQSAKDFILVRCQVTSRNDLDLYAYAAERFHELVRKPFLAWKEGRP